MRRKMQVGANKSWEYATTYGQVEIGLAVEFITHTKFIVKSEHNKIFAPQIIDNMERIIFSVFAPHND
jgi:hypothetical protein